jgi:hypothetical protein
MVTPRYEGVSPALMARAKFLRLASLVLALYDVSGKKLSNYFWRPMTMIGTLANGCAVDSYHIG